MKKEDAIKLAEAGLTQLNEDLSQGHSETLLRYLDFLANFHRYSFRNVMMIEMQRPDTTHVAGFHSWRKLGRTVRKGETGIAIFAPMVARKCESQTEQTIEEEAGPALYGFRVVHVFDVKQTEGKDIPQLASVSGDPGEYLGRLEHIVATRSILLRYASLPGGTQGASMNGTILVAKELSVCATFSVLVHEFAHELLHYQNDRPEKPSRIVAETEAEAVAYVVCRALGLETTRQSVDYIHLHQGSADVLAKSLNAIQRTAAQILEALATKASDPKDVRHAA